MKDTTSCCIFQQVTSGKLYEMSCSHQSLQWKRHALLNTLQCVMTLLWCTNEHETGIYILIGFQNEADGKNMVLRRRLGWNRTEVLLCSAMEEEEKEVEDQLLWNPQHGTFHCWDEDCIRLSCTSFLKLCKLSCLKGLWILRKEG